MATEVDFNDREAIEWAMRSANGQCLICSKCGRAMLSFRTEPIDRRSIRVFVHCGRYGHDERRLIITPEDLT